jgi:hypothetical protein
MSTENNITDTPVDSVATTTTTTEEQQQQQETTTDSNEVKIDVEKALQSGLSTFTFGSSSDLKAELLKDVDASTRQILSRVRKSIHVAKQSDPNLRLAHDDASGMKAIDMGALMGLIKDTELKQQVQKKVAESEKMVKDISSLLSSEGFL